MKTLILHIEEEAHSTEQLAGILEDIAILLRRGKTRSFKPAFTVQEKDELHTVGGLTHDPRNS